VKIGIIDLDTGNLASLKSAFQKLNINYGICKEFSELNNFKKFILPGVAAFPKCMKKIKETKIDKILYQKVLSGSSLLGICAGFQILFESSNEYEVSLGLNFFDEKIKNFKDFDNKIKTPHVGWNQCKILNKNRLFEGINDMSDFYFSHTYMLNNLDEKYIVSKTEYKINFISSINNKNIYGVQFHPEKSQSNGLRIIKNFCEYC
jgi:glutamine amidotransferase